jgi:hypothetical protein
MKRNKTKRKEKKLSFKFEIPDEDADKSRIWRQEHKKVCELRDVGAIGGKYTWLFTPTSLGCIIILKCACGEELDLSHSENW